MKPRLLLLPGFGEDTYCFNEIVPHIKGYQFVHVDYRNALDKFTFPFITVNQFSRELIHQYKITPQDKLVGHSMGGYFAFQIREIVGCQICMIAAFNDTKKVLHLFPKFPRITQISTLFGISKSELVRNFLLNKIKNEDYKKIQAYTMRNFKTFSNIQLALMTQMLYEKGIPSKLPNPLRIHDKADKVIAAPNEAYHSVKGGHFCLSLYPEETITYMQDFLTINDKQ